MKNLKINKVQILAALALAFSLGMAMPAAVFADGGEGAGEPAVQAENTATAPTPTDLYNAITAAKADPGYAKYSALATAMKNLPQDGATATTAQLTAVRQAIAAINPEAQVGDADAAALREYVDGMEDYKVYSNMLDAIDKVQTAVGAGVTITAALINEKVPAKDIPGYYNTIEAFNNRVTGSLADNIVKLYTRINDTSNAKFNAYRSGIPLVTAVETLEALGADASSAQVTAAMNAVKAQMTGVAGLDGLDKAQLIAKAKEVEGFTNNRALYDALAFTRAMTSPLTAAAIESVYKTQAEQMTVYSKLAAAAKAVDSTVMKGLMAYELPTTSAPEEKPTTPDSGIVGLIESGALDLGTVMLIVSVAVAGLAGAALIAKLYLKHKF